MSERDEVTVYDKTRIDVEKLLRACINEGKKEHVANFGSENMLQISYKAELKGVGFAAWLKNQ